MHIRNSQRPLMLVSVFFALMNCIGGARADIVSPEALNALKRMQNNPKAFDKVDQFCNDKAVGAKCQIPGSLFEGGGAGICKRDILFKSEYILLGCKLDETVEIDRQLPQGPYRVDLDLCESKFSVEEYICTEPSILNDRFCSDSKVGQSCVAEISVNGKKSTHNGICAVVEEKTHFYNRGWRTGSRKILSCEPVNKAPEVEFKPVSQWKKLKQW